MFDFEKLEVYHKVQDVNVKVLTYLSRAEGIDEDIKDQWKKASMSALINLAEGTGRISRQEKKQYYTIARGSVFECVAILNLLKETELIDNEFYEDVYDGYESCSKMLLAMYRSMDSQISRREGGK
jgi:four helix bundle protein